MMYKILPVVGVGTINLKTTKILSKDTIFSANSICKIKTLTVLSLMLKYLNYHKEIGANK